MTDSSTDSAERLVRHSRNQKIHLNHEKHENSRKKANTVLPQRTQSTLRKDKYTSP